MRPAGTTLTRLQENRPSGAEEKITNVKSTKNRPEAQKVVDFIIKHYGLRHNTPHVCLNVVDGVCLPGEMRGRYNLHNIVATVHAIREIFDDKLWTESQISVITPYHEQAAKYRQVFRRQKWFKIQVFTVDSKQGQENACTIFDLVLSYHRIGGLGFEQEESRLNVALSRWINHFILVCDLAALNHDDRHLQQLDKLDGEAGQACESADREVSKYLRGVFNHFETKQMTYMISAESLNDMSLVDLTPVREFRRRNICHNCYQLGHKKMDCPEVTCYNCQKKGHMSFKCTDPAQPKPRKGRELGFTLPYGMPKAGETKDTEETEGPVYMPVIPTAWLEFEAEECTLDGGAIEKELARMDSDEDNEEEPGSVQGEDDENQTGVRLDAGC